MSSITGLYKSAEPFKLVIRDEAGKAFTNSKGDISSVYLINPAENKQLKSLRDSFDARFKRGQEPSEEANIKHGIELLKVSISGWENLDNDQGEWKYSSKAVEELLKSASDFLINQINKALFAQENFTKSSTAK